MNIQKHKKSILQGLVIAGLLVGVAVPQPARAAACAAPSTDYGTASVGLTIPSATTYRLWTRMSVPDTTNSTYLLDVDGSTCFTVGGSSIAPSGWVWVDYQSSGTANKVQLSLTQGTHTLKLIGNAPNVKIDRILAMSDLTCTPVDFGDNCNTPSDTTAPTVNLTTPAQSTTVSGTVTLSADATDNTGVTKVELYDNSTLLKTVTNSPYSTPWDTTKVANGSHVLTAKAYDAAGNVGTDSNTVTVQNGDNQAPTTPTGLSAGAPAYNQVKLSWNASTDNVGVTGYTIIRDGVPLVDVGKVTTYTDTQSILPSTTYQYKVLAFDAAGNKSAASSAVNVTTPGTPDTQAPTAPSNVSASATSSTQVSLSWSASSDNIGVAKYDVYRANAGSNSYQLISSTQTLSYGDTNLTANTQYSYYVVAKDAAGNASSASSKATVTTQQAPTTTTNLKITGTITDSATGKPVKYATVTIVAGNTKHYHRANRYGQYAIRRLKTGRYNLTFAATGYKPLAVSVQLGTSSVVQNVSLTKK